MSRCDRCGDRVHEDEGVLYGEVTGGECGDNQRPDGSYGPHMTDDEEPDREPSAEQEKAWNEQYNGTSFGA